jgi:hypothetical protein
MHDIAGAMTQANAGAAVRTIRRIDLDDPQAISLRTNTEAVNYATYRSAELVGRKYDADGNLVDNPDAAAAITDTMRKVLREEIRDAVGLHLDVDQLADRLEQTGLFSDARAEMIARTEINMAQNQGVLEAGRQARAAGLPVQKIWVLGDNPCPQCEDAAAEGAIDLDDNFGDEAGDAPPLHPNCECNLDLFVADEEEEAKMMTRTQTLTRIVRKAGGLAPLCQRIVKRGYSDISEAELTGMATELAKHEYPSMDDAQAFTRLYAGNELLRRALMVAKAEPMPEPEGVGGDDATDVNDPAKALAQLQAMIAELRGRARHLSESELWNRVTRENPALTKRAIVA